MSKPSEKGDPFANLPRFNLTRRYTDLQKQIMADADEDRAAFVKPRVVPKVELAKAAVVEVEDAKRTRGRPKTAKPWEGGCSKAEWYRRKAAGK